MRPASDSILSAVERTDLHEDRLTEVLACVAKVNEAFAASLVRMAGLIPRKGEHHEVGTQQGTSGGRRVDMEIAAYDGPAHTKLVWVEAKDGAVYQPNQLSDYAEQVQDPVDGHPDGRVLTIIPPGEKPKLDDRWVTKTWSDVAVEADRLGREWGRKSGESHWHQAAMKPEAPSQWRYLAELVERLERKGHARMQPLTPEDVVAAQRHASLSEALRDLRRAARLDIDGVKPTKSSSLDLGWYQRFEPTEEKWFSDVEQFGKAYPALLYYHREDWTPDQLGAPAFCAGITFEKPSRATRYALDDEIWRARLPDGVMVVDGVMAVGSGKVLRVARTMYLSELIVAGATLHEQARALGAWASKAIGELMDGPAPTRSLDAAAPVDDEDANGHA
jgi:hypothetical protein